MKKSRKKGKKNSNYSGKTSKLFLQRPCFQPVTYQADQGTCSPTPKLFIQQLHRQYQWRIAADLELNPLLDPPLTV